MLFTALLEVRAGDMCLHWILLETKVDSIRGMSFGDSQHILIKMVSL